MKGSVTLMNKFVEKLSKQEIKNIGRIYEFIDIALDECVNTLLDQNEDNVEYDKRRGLFIVPMKNDRTMFTVISHNAISVSLEVRYVDHITNQETAITNLIISIEDSEIKSTQQTRVDLIHNSQDAYLINNFFWFVTDRIFHPVEKVPVNDGLGTLVSKNSDTDLIAVDSSTSLIQE